MVSFQCEECGDVFTKKKLDGHRNQCRRASFSCLDCMAHFNGTEYRSHTSCISEAQKYEGSLYKDKKKSNPAKTTQKRKSVTIAPDALQIKPQGPYVEDVPDMDDPNHNMASQSLPPPPAPSPPPTTPTIPPPPASSSSAQPNGSSKVVNVFDFLDQSSNAPTDEYGQMKMVAHAPSVFDTPRERTRLEDGRDDDLTDYDLAYEENGYSYGAGPIPPPAPMPYNEVSNVSLQFMTTPAPQKKPKRRDRTPRDQPPPSLEHSRASSLTGTSDKKRKRGQPQELVLDDTPMTDAPSSAGANALSTPALNHSGLTGGLSQLMRTQYSMSPDPDRYEPLDDEEGYKDPPSPIKRTRRGNNNRDHHGHHAENGLGISVRKGEGGGGGGGGGGAGRKLMSLLGGATGVTGGTGSSNDPSSRALVRTRRRSSSDGADDKARKALRKQKHARRRGTSTALVPTNGHHRHDDNSDEEDQPRRLKAIEYHKDKSNHKDDGDNNSNNNNANDNQLVLYNNKDKNSSDSADESSRRDRASQFLALVNKGPDSERGCSVHKALKRYHRDYSASRGPEEHERGRAHGRGRGHGHGRSSSRRDDEERDLWRILRLKKNERGEVVVFF